MADVFALTSRIGSFDWFLDEVRDLHAHRTAAMSREIPALVSSWAPATVPDG